MKGAKRWTKEKLQEILKDENFIAELSKAEPEQMVTLFKDKGVELTESEAKKVTEYFKEPEADTQLSLDDLDQVAGGNFFTEFIRHLCG